MLTCLTPSVHVSSDGARIAVVDRTTLLRAFISLPADHKAVSVRVSYDDHSITSPGLPSMFVSGLMALYFFGHADVFQLKQDLLLISLFTASVGELYRAWKESDVSSQTKLRCNIDSGLHKQSNTVSDGVWY